MKQLLLVAILFSIIGCESFSDQEIAKTKAQSDSCLNICARGVQSLKTGYQSECICR